MSYEVSNINNYTFHNYNFDNLTSLIDYINNNNFNKNWANSYYSVAKDARTIENTGTNCFDEAVDLLLHGNNDERSNLMNIKENLENLFPYKTQKRIIEPSVYGFRPNIPKYLTNSPYSMYKLVRKEENKFVDIYFNVANAIKLNKKEAIYNRGIFLILLIELLEKNNYCVRLNFFELSCIKIDGDIKEVFYCSVNIKLPSERLNSSLTIFPMCHPSYSRRIMFALKERTNFKHTVEWKNYGIVVKKEELLENFSEILGIKENSIIIPSPFELGIKGFDTIADLKNFLQRLNISNFFSENENLHYDDNLQKFVFARKKINYGYYK